MATPWATDPVAWAQLRAVQDPALVERIRTGALSVREQRGLGLPWSPELVQRSRRAAGRPATRVMAAERWPPWPARS